MKRLTFLLVCISYFSHAQDAPLQTTEEEYNYMTKGYRIQIQSGLDMKKGYTFSDSEVIPIGNYSFEVKSLIREAEDELAGILVISKSKVSGNTYYIAIPIGNEELMERYYADLDAWDSSILTAYSYVISSHFANTLNRVHGLEKSR